MLNDRIEVLVLKSLINTEEFTRRVLPFIQPEYFEEEHEKIVFNKIKEFITEYTTIPSKEALLINCNQDSHISAESYKRISDYISNLDFVNDTKPDLNYLITATEKWCQEKAVYNGILSCIRILDDKSGKTSKGSIPKILSDALSVSFDPNVGHNYLEDFQARYDFYHRVEEKVSFDLKYLNKITNGGVSKKSLNIILAGTAVGKSLAMCHMAGAAMVQGKNVLYITLEMSKERIAERVDANLLNIALIDLVNLPKDLYEKKINALRAKTTGKLIVKEYPTASASSTHFRALMNELLLKKNFKPDIIFIDYLNIACSSRIVHTSNVNSYTYIKSIAEEFRGMAVEYDVPIWSATQTTRTGFASSDLELSDTSESFGLPATADFMIAMIATEELQKMNQILVKQLKNRYNDVNTNKRFILGVDRSKMRLFDVEESAQTLAPDDTEKGKDIPQFDKTKFGGGMKSEKQKFDDWNF